MSHADPFRARRRIQTLSGPVVIFDIAVLEDRAGAGFSTRPVVERILLENLIRNAGNGTVAEDLVLTVAKGGTDLQNALPLTMSRVVLQDASGLPLLMDLAAQRSALARLGHDPALARPKVPADMIIDHSVHTDYAGTPTALRRNMENEYRRNRERFAFLKWAQGAIEGLRVVPPGNGIIHQINLEYLSRVITCIDDGGDAIAFPEMLVGTDSHTTMINGLGVVGWGVGAIEALSVMLGEPRYIKMPEIVGIRLDGALREGATPTDLVLTLTELLRGHDLSGKIIEFCGNALEELPLADRATVANMAPEYGSTMAFFPVDAETLAYLRLTGRDTETVDLVERYTKETGLFRPASGAPPRFDKTIVLDLATIEPTLSGPKRPHDRVPLRWIKRAFPEHLVRGIRDHGFGLPPQALDRRVQIRLDDTEIELRHGTVAIAAITSCVNTSNPTVMIGAGLLARKAVECGLRSPPWVRTSLALGSKAVHGYLKVAMLMPSLEALGFHVTGYGCMSCGGKTGPLAPEIVEGVEREGLVVVSVLSGNRNFEGRINPHARASYLASPMLVVAFALAGRIDFDFDTEPLGWGADGQAVFLRDLWPSTREIRETMASAISAETFHNAYATISDGGDAWKALPVQEGSTFNWDPDSSFLREPPYCTYAARALSDDPEQLDGARVLVLLGDSVTTDHIYPASMIAPDSAAGLYLKANGIAEDQLHSFTARRGNHEVVARGTFANARLRNLLLDNVEGGLTRLFPAGMPMSIYDAALAYAEEGTPVIVMAGKDYGSGSARDLAAKGPLLLGVRAVIAESFGATHRANLVGMGIVPLQFLPGDSRESLGLEGDEIYSLTPWGVRLCSERQIAVTTTGADGRRTHFRVAPRIETEVERSYLAHGGILPTIMKRLIEMSGGGNLNASARTEHRSAGGAC